MKDEEIRRKVIEILTDYKFNNTQIFTTKQQADRIIELIEQAERKRILELIDEFGDKILNVNTTSKNFIEIPDFEYRLKLLKKEVEK